MNKVVCQNKNLGSKYCEGEFTIFPEDTLFYEKIKVPPPTFCPTCRMIRRLSWRNNRSLYGRTCGLCSKSLISMYKDDGAPVYCETCYAGDGWDMYEYAQDVDFSQPFLFQLKSLFQKQPRVFSIRFGTNIQSDYSNSLVSCKNAYLTFSSIDSENVFYNENADKCKNTYDSLSVEHVESSSWNIDSVKNFNSHYMVNTDSCIDSFFLYDCTNCSNCFMSSNLRNQTYYFRNQKLDKEAYLQKLKELRLHESSSLEIYKKEFTNLIKNSIHRYADTIGSVNAIGDSIHNSKDIKNSFTISESENIAYSYRMIKTKDCVDSGWVLGSELEYETMTGSGGGYNQVACFMCITGCTNIYYSISCRNSSYCFGCIGLTNAKYCILNK